MLVSECTGTGFFYDADGAVLDSKTTCINRKGQGLHQ